MAKKQGLGKKFESIFDESPFSAEEAESISTLKVVEIEPNRDQPRKIFDREALNALADSIREHGIIQPLTVREVDGTYRIVAGERRWRAAKIAGLNEVPVRIMELSDEQAAQIALIENLQREDLDPIEEANGYQQLMEIYGMTQDDVAKKIGKARSTITNTLRLLDLPAGIQLMVQHAELSSGHCKALLGIEDEKLQTSLAKVIFDQQMSVRDAEKYVKDNIDIKRPKPLKPEKSQLLKEAEVSLGNYIGYPVKINSSKKHKITISIECIGEVALKEILHKIQGE